MFLLLLGACWWLDTPTLGTLLDHSVNDAVATLPTDGTSGLQLRAEAGANPEGAFNGTGTGNKAIAGVPGFDGFPLADLSGLAYESTLVTGDWTPYFNLLVDLDCAGAGVTIVVADASRVVPVGDRYAFDATEAVWTAVGGLDTLLPSHLASTAGTLSSVVADYPDACLRDADSGDAGMPFGVVTSSVLLILGDSLNTSEAEHRLSALEVGAWRYEGP